MTLRHRTSMRIYIARPAPRTGSMGEVGETFADVHQTALGHLLPAAGTLKAHAAGSHPQETLTLILPPETAIHPGDGVGLQEKHYDWRVTRCERYPLHICAHLEARTR